MCNQKVRTKHLAAVLFALAGMLGWLGLTSRKTLTKQAAAPATAGKVRAEQKASRARAAESYSKLPMRFEANEGQSGSPVDFLARGRGYTMFLKSTEAVVALKHGNALRMQFLGANPGAKAVAMEQLPGSVNYFIGSDPSKWRTNVRTYGRISYKDVYAGVDLLYYGNRQQLEYDLVVGQGADPGVVRLGISGATKLQLGRDGDIRVDTAGGTVRLRKPVAYQRTLEGQNSVNARYVLQGKDHVAFELGTYDRTKPLIIDPVLIYSSFLGGSGNETSMTDPAYLSGIAVDAAGSAYVTGMTDSSNFPTANAFQPSFAGGNYDVFVTKFTPDGSALMYSTYLGGSGQDLAGDIAVDASGNAYLTGQTASTDFPTTVGAFQVSKKTGGANPAVFVTKLNPSGSALIYSTYLGGSLSDLGNGIAVDSLGRASVTGQADSLDFPVTAGAPQTQSANYDGHAFVTTLAANGASLVFSTYLGGRLVDSGNGIAVDSLNNIYVVGNTSSPNFPTVNALQPIDNGTTNAFISKLNPDTSTLIYSTYLGGSFEDRGLGVAVDSSNSVYVTGFTSSSDFPTVNPIQATLLGPAGLSMGVFVSKLNAAGSALVYSTYLGGGNYVNGNSDVGTRIAVDSIGAAYVTGTSASGVFPAVNSLYPFQGGNPFVTKFTPDGSALVYSTFLPSGGPAIAIAVDALFNAYVMGITNNSSFPTTPGAAQRISGGLRDAFVVKLSSDRTTTNATTSLTPSSYGEQITFTATVTANIATVRNPSGAVSFADGATILGSAPLSNGTATFNSSSLTAGSHTITVQYGGDPYFGASAATLGQLVDQAATTTTLKASPNPAAVGQSITFTATVAAVSPGAGSPTGTVNFTDGATTIGTATVSAGTATFSIATLTLGSHTMVASYGGDPNFTASASSGLSQAVAQPGATIMVNESVKVADAPTLLGLPPFVAINVMEGVTVSDLPKLLASAPYVVINIMEGVTASDVPYAGFSSCDLQQTGSVSVADVQALINEALGMRAPVDDLNGDLKVNVVDVEIEINGALGLGCVAYH